MKYRNTKIWDSTIKNLRRIYAETGERMVSILDRLVAAEWEAVKDRINTES